MFFKTLFLYICPIYKSYYMNFNPFKDWFYYSKGQRKGISVLLMLIIVTPVFTGIAKRMNAPGPIDKETFLAEVELLQQKMMLAAESSAEKTAGVTANTTAERQTTRQRPALKPFAFDPNTLTPEEWDSLGMPRHISRSIGNFLTAGGSFRFKEDLRRIYLLEDWMYEELEAYIELPKRPVRQSAEGSGTSGSNHENRDSGSMAAAAKDQGTRSASSLNKKTDNVIHVAEPLVINLNVADTTELQRIRGIGPAFSRRIVGYRELLGGFVNTEQLLEVYGLDSTRYEAIKEFIITDTLHITKISLNTADYAELVRHPYINRQTANAILNIRNQHGAYSEINEITKSYLIDDITFTRIKPYLCVENQ